MSERAVNGNPAGLGALREPAGGEPPYAYTVQGRETAANSRWNTPYVLRYWSIGDPE